MNFEKLDTASANPRPRWKLVAKQSVEIRLRYVPEADRADIVHLRLPALDDRLTAVYETWGSTEAMAEAALDEFDTRLMADAQAYHERARKAAGDGIDERASESYAHRYHGLEVDGLRHLLQPGERVQEFAWLSVKTSQRTISRTEMRAAARPTTWSNESTWTRQFIPIDQLVNLEQEELKAAQRAAAPTYGKNLDYPGGVRPGVGR